LAGRRPALVGAASAAEFAGRTAAAVDEPSTTVGQLAAVRAEARAGLRRATAVVGRAPAAAGVWRLTGPTVQLDPAAVREFSAVGLDALAGDRRAAADVGRPTAPAGLRGGAATALLHLATSIRREAALGGQVLAALGEAGRLPAFVGPGSAAEQPAGALAAAELAATTIQRFSAQRTQRAAGLRLAPAAVVRGAVAAPRVCGAAGVVPQSVEIRQQRTSSPEPQQRNADDEQPDEAKKPEHPLSKIAWQSVGCRGPRPWRRCLGSDPRKMS
jgi:hypothetical protein